MAQLLIELFSEEIPARMQLGAARDFERLFGSKLSAAGLSHEGLKAYVGPRRLALVVDGLPLETAAITEEVKGPKESAPPQAMEGFLRKVSLTQDQLTLENGVWMARIEKPGVKTADVLGDMLRDVILSFPWPKSMRSGASAFRWVRPLKRILFLFDGEVIPFELEGLTASNMTEGHRFLGSGQPLSVSNFASYQKALVDNSVILDHAERQKIILEQAKAVCAEAGCELIEDQGLLEEVAGLNEFPVPLLGDMDPAFLTLPPEVIKTSMKTHQKYFSVGGATGRMIRAGGTVSQADRVGYPAGDKLLTLKPHFVITSNMKAVDGGAEIKRGNAKVLSARLSDGVFFWKEDNREGNFDQWLTKLEGVTFHAKLGSMAERVVRIVEVAKYLAPIFGVDTDLAAQVAHMSKADLASHMVSEFPELQGVMGGYYAKAAGYDPEIANAISDHYKPQGPSDGVPINSLTAVVALADKIDTLVGFFAIGEKPTGSKDPFALRRSALGVLRILREFGTSIDLSRLFKVAYQELMRHSDTVKDRFWRRSADRINVSLEVSQNMIEFLRIYRTNPTPYVMPENAWATLFINEIADEILDFFVERLKIQLKDEGFRFDIIEAVFALKDGDLVRQTQRIAALENMLKTSQGEDLLAAHKRAANILAAEAKKGDLPTGEPRALPGAPMVETALLTQLNIARRVVGTALDEEKYIDVLHEIAAMRQNVDAFLDGVLVNADDAAVRANRLLILKAVCDLSGDVADLSKIT